MRLIYYKDFGDLIHQNTSGLFNSVPWRIKHIMWYNGQAPRSCKAMIYNGSLNGFNSLSSKF